MRFNFTFGCLGKKRESLLKLHVAGNMGQGMLLLECELFRSQQKVHTVQTSSSVSRCALQSLVRVPCEGMGNISCSHTIEYEVERQGCWLGLCRSPRIVLRNDAG